MPEAATVLALRQTQTLGTQAAALLATAPMLVLAPLNYTIVNLRPFDIQVYVYSPKLVVLSEAWRFGGRRLNAVIHTGRKQSTS